MLHPDIQFLAPLRGAFRPDFRNGVTAACFLVAVLLHGALRAQTTETDSLRKLDEVVVTGTKVQIARDLVPFSVSQVSQQQIERSGEINLLPVLSQSTPGVFVTERNILGFGVAQGSAGGINIRGLGGSPNSQVLVLLDGHPQFMGIFGHPLPDAYVSSDAHKVEVIRGPASVLYGSNAMGGVINIITREPESDGLRGQLNANYGSFQTQQYSGNLAYKEGPWSVFVSANHDRTNGLGDYTDFEITNGYAKVGRQIGKHWKASADLSLAAYEANDEGPEFDPDSFSIDILRGKAAVSVDNAYDKTEGSVKLYHNFGEHDLSTGFQSTDRHSGAMVYQSYHLSEQTTLTGGVDYKNFGGEANQGAAADETKTIEEIGGYVYARQALGEQVTLNAGLRLDHNSAYGDILVPFGGATYQPVEATTLKASVSRGFRSPTVQELYVFSPNPNLNPETVLNYELTLQQKLGGRARVELTPYLLTGDNLIQTEGQFPNVQRVNSGAFTNRGVELAGTYLATDRLTLRGNYSYLDLDQPVLAAPRQQVNLNGHYRFNRLGLYMALQHIDQLYTSVMAEEATQNYTLLDVRVSYKMTDFLRLHASANNLLDQEYQINNGYPMPGINFFGGLRVNFGGDEKN